MEKKVFNSEIKSIDKEAMTITAYVSTVTKDRMGEVLDPEGVDLRNYKKNPVVLWAHNYELPPIGKAVWIKKDGQGVISKVQFAKTPFAQEIFDLYDGGFLRAFSVGFVPKEYEDGDGDKKPRRTYKKWEMLEYSAVPVPANPDAITLAIKKGVLKNDDIIKSLSDAEDEADEEEMSGQNDLSRDKTTCPTSVEAIGKEIEEDELGLEDVLAENALLRSQIESLESDVTGLKYEKYLLLTKLQNTLSGIAVDTLASKTVELINGAIRRHQGRLD